MTFCVALPCVGPALSSPESLARAVIDELVGGGHGGQGVGAGDKSLIEGIVLQGIGIDVIHVLGSLHILIGQTLHVIKLVDQATTTLSTSCLRCRALAFTLKHRLKVRWLAASRSIRRTFST